MSTAGPREGAPFLFETDGATWLANESPRAEILGPAGIIVRVASEEEMREVAQAGRPLRCT